MNDADRLTASVFAQGMALLAERWNREISPGVSRIYATALRDLGATLFVVGVTRAIEECEFFPSAAKIRALAKPEAPADVRAGDVLRAVMACGVHGPNGRSWSVTTIAERCGDAAARAFVAAGGGQRLAAVTDSDFPFLLRDFAHAFAAFSEEAIANDVVARRLETVRTGRIGAKTVAAGLTPIENSIAAAIPADILPQLARADL